MFGSIPPLAIVLGIAFVLLLVGATSGFRAMIRSLIRIETDAHDTESDGE